MGGTAASEDPKLFHKHNDSGTLVSWPSVKKDAGQMKKQTKEKDAERKDKVKRSEERALARETTCFGLSWWGLHPSYHRARLLLSAEAIPSYHPEREPREARRPAGPQFHQHRCPQPDGLPEACAYTDLAEGTTTWEAAEPGNSSVKMLSMQLGKGLPLWSLYSAPCLLQLIISFWLLCLQSGLGNGCRIV